MTDTHQRQNTPRQVIILLGPPGSGKGTQALQITRHLHIPHISTGDLLRKNVKDETELGKLAKEYMNSGKLVPDALVLNMLSERISCSDCNKGYLLDGFPRTILQAEALEKLLKEPMKHRVISLNISDDAIIKRMSGRLLCKKCGHIHNKYSSPPMREGLCDRCNGELYQRPDDAVDVVKERLKVYHDQTKPLIEFYKNKGVLSSVLADQDPSILFTEISRLLSGSSGK